MSAILKPIGYTLIACGYGIRIAIAALLLVPVALFTALAGKPDITGLVDFVLLRKEYATP